MTNKLVYIECRNNEGNIRKLTIRGWFETTGKPISTIRAQYHRKRMRINNLTNRQIVGFDEVIYDAPVGKKKPRAELAPSKFNVINIFLRKRLCPGGEFSKITCSGWAV